MICRNCGLLYCQFCKDKLFSSPSPDPSATENAQVSPASCKCSGGDIQSLDDLRGYLIQDFLNYKYKIQVIANEPVEHFQMLLDLREKLIAIGKRFILLPEDFSFQKDPLSTFSMAEQFALEHLQDIRHNIRDLYGKLLVNKEQLVDHDQLKQVNLKLHLLAGKIDQFEQGFQSYFYPVLEDKKIHEENLVPFVDFSEKLTQDYQNLEKYLDDDERIFFISEPLSSNLSGTITRNIQLLITEKQMLFFKQPILKLKKKVKVIKSVTGFEVIGLLQKNRKFRSSGIIIKTINQEIELTGLKDQITMIEKFIKILVENIRIPTPKEWKHYQIGRIWSSDGYYTNVDNILRWELRTGVKNPNNNLFPEAAGMDFPDGDGGLEHQTQILEYIDRQMEKTTQRIRVIEYIIDDLKSRRNTMPVTDFFTLYEQFSIKLKDLESERNSLLSNYSKTNNRPTFA